MGWNPFKKIEQFVSDIGKSVEKTVSDVWESDIGKAAIIAPAAVVAGPAILPVLGAGASAVLGVPAAIGGVASGLSSIIPAVEAGVGLYGQLAQIKTAKEMTEAQKIAAQKGLIEAEAMKLYVEQPPKTAIPTLAQQPVYVTPAAAPSAPNYLLYIGLGILAIILLRKK